MNTQSQPERVAISQHGTSVLFTSHPQDGPYVMAIQRKTNNSVPFAIPMTYQKTRNYYPKQVMRVSKVKCSANIGLGLV
jgi:hypothetical protein